MPQLGRPYGTHDEGSINSEFSRFRLCPLVGVFLSRCIIIFCGLPAANAVSFSVLGFKFVATNKCRAFNLEFAFFHLLVSFGEESIRKYGKLKSSLTPYLRTRGRRTFTLGNEVSIFLGIIYKPARLLHVITRKTTMFASLRT